MGEDLNNKLASTGQDGEKNDNQSVINKLVEQIEENNPGLLENVPEKNKLVEEILGILSSSGKIALKQSIEERHERPLPSPKVLEDYDKIVSGGAERIFSVFENQSNHRMDFESRALNSEINLNHKGQNYAFIISLVFVAAGVFLVVTGNNTAGIA